MKDIFVNQGADSNRNMADYEHLFEDEIPISGSSLGSGVHMSIVRPWTSTGAEPICEYSLQSLYLTSWSSCARFGAVLALLASSTLSDLDFQADSTMDVGLARTTKNTPVRHRVFLAFQASP